MLVSLYPNFSQRNKVSNIEQSSKSSYLSKSLLKDQVSFGDGGASWIILAARGGIEALRIGPKQYNILKFLNEVDSIIKSPSRHIGELADTLSALAKVPDDTQSYPVTTLMYMVSGRDELYIGDLRRGAVSLLSKIKDDSFVNIQSKKDFVRSFLDNGIDLLDGSIKSGLRELSDSNYKTFKQEIVDNVLYSKKFVQREKDLYYNTQVDPYAEKDYRYASSLRNLEIIDTLNPTTHAEYLTKIQSTIIGFKKQVFSYLAEAATGLPDRFLPPNKFQQFSRFRQFGEHDQYAEILWNETAKACNHDAKHISKALNIPEHGVKYILLSNQLQ